MITQIAEHSQNLAGNAQSAAWATQDMRSVFQEISASADDMNTAADTLIEGRATAGMSEGIGYISSRYDMLKQLIDGLKEKSGEAGKHLIIRYFDSLQQYETRSGRGLGESTPQ